MVFEAMKNLNNLVFSFFSKRFYLTQTTLVSSSKSCFNWRELITKVYSLTISSLFHLKLNVSSSWEPLIRFEGNERVVNAETEVVVNVDYSEGFVEKGLKVASLHV